MSCLYVYYVDECEYYFILFVVVLQTYTTLRNHSVLILAGPLFILRLKTGTRILRGKLFSSIRLLDSLCFFLLLGTYFSREAFANTQSQTTLFHDPDSWEERHAVFPPPPSTLVRICRPGSAEEGDP